MQFARALRFLSLPAAIVLGTALAVACSDGVPTSVEQSLKPEFAPKKGGGGGTLYYDDDGTGNCKNNDLVILSTDSGYDASFDVNLNNKICYKTTGGGGKHK